MKKGKLIVLFSLALVIAISGTVFTATVKGKLLDIEGNPIPAKEVKIEAQYFAPIMAITSLEGEFKFDDISPGEWKLQVADETLESIIVQINILSNDEVASHNIYSWKRKDLSANLSKMYFGANEKYNEGELEEAITMLNNVIEKTPDFFGPYALKGKILYLEEEYDEAVPAIKKAFELNPYLSASNKTLAEYYFFREKDYEQAKKYYEKLLLSLPTDPIILEQMGNICYITKDFEDAVEYFRKAIEYYPEQKSANQSYYWLGVCQLKTKKFEKALKNFEKFLELAPNHYDAPKTKKLVDALKKKIKQDKQKEEK